MKLTPFGMFCIGVLVLGTLAILAVWAKALEQENDMIEAGDIPAPSQRGA